MKKEIYDFVNNNFFCPFNERISNKAKHYLNIKNNNINSEYLNYLKLMAEWQK